MVPYLRAANIKDGYLDLSDIKEMNFTPDEQRVFSLNPGDVLVSEGAGSLQAVGASAV
jgi:type I restriction enzyme S subunit